MPPLDIKGTVAICRKCGTAYSRYNGYFPKCYAPLYKGTGFLPYCRDCVDKMYDVYYAECQDSKSAVRQMCRKLNLYWSNSLFNQTEKRSSTRSIMTNYLASANGANVAGKCYDDTLREEGLFWAWPTKHGELPTPEVAEPEPKVKEDPVEDIEIPKEVLEFWGPGYSPSMYEELEQRRAVWMSKFPKDVDLDIGTEALIRQICSLELDINRDRSAGRPVDKSINALNTLLGSLNLKPVQKRSAEEIDSNLAGVPLGVWIHRYEYERPLPEIDEELKDVNHHRKYILTWVLGHLSKMLGVKNAYARMYEDEISKLRVEHPEFDEEDDALFMSDVFGDDWEDYAENADEPGDIDG